MPACTSVSCLHVIEHIGLGRYGDAIDPHGSEKAAQELIRVLDKWPALGCDAHGRERVQFNAYRVFAPQTIVQLFERVIWWILPLLTMTDHSIPALCRSNCSMRLCLWYVRICEEGMA